MLKGEIIANNSYVAADQIGSNEDDAFNCLTDKKSCCRSSDGTRAGEWYFPNGTKVDIQGPRKDMQNISYFYRNRGPSVVRLISVENPSERGQFFCEVPDSQDENQRVYVNIGKSKLKRHNLVKLFSD